MLPPTLLLLALHPAIWTMKLIIDPKTTRHLQSIPLTPIHGRICICMSLHPKLSSLEWVGQEQMLLTIWYPVALQVSQKIRIIAEFHSVHIYHCICRYVFSRAFNTSKGVTFLALNTDAQHLSTSLSPTRLQIGTHLTSGLGMICSIDKNDRISSHLTQCY